MSSYTHRTTKMQLEQNKTEMEQHFHILAKMKQFRNKEIFCDAKVIVNGTIFIVHKTVLAAWSSVFASELLPSSISHEKTNIHVSYDNIDAFSDFVEFLYSGFVELNDYNIEPLLHIGKHFNVHALVNQCENFLCNAIGLDNFVTNYFVCRKYELSELEESISNFVQYNISQVIEQEKFLSLTPQKFSTFIKTGKMAFAKQEVQFSLIAGWVGSELETREKYLLHLLSLVKWINPVSDLLIQIQHTETIFMVNEFCLFQLLHNLYGVFGDKLGAFTSTYYKLLNLYKFKLPDLLNISDIRNEIGNRLPDIPITVMNTSKSDTEFNIDADSIENIKKKAIGRSGYGFQKEKVINVDVGVNTEVSTEHSKEFKDTDSQTFLESPESNSAILMNFKKGESPNLDMVCQEFTEYRMQTSSKDNVKSKNRRRKSEPRKRKIKVENDGMKLKSVLVVESAKKKRGRHRKADSNRNNKRNDECRDELLTVKHEPVDPGENKDTYNVDTDDTVDWKEELELWGIKDGDMDMYDNDTAPNEDDDHTYKPNKNRKVKTKKSEKSKVNRKLKRPKQPYKPPNLPFKCTEEGCTFSTKTNARLEKHIASFHHTDVKLYCKKCDYVAPLMKDLCLHMKKNHISGPPFRCDFERCKFQASRMGLLIVHQMQHIGERPYSCDLCTKSFFTANRLSCHKKLHEGRLFVCDVCNKGFSTKGIMKQHRSIHFDKKAYLCDMCGFATKHPGMLVAHRKIHTGDLVRCTFHNCSYATPKPSLMTEHMNRHLNVRDHICQVCGKSFVVRCKLLRHEKIHLDHKLFKCKQCEYTTIRTDRMKLHLNTHGIVFKKKNVKKLFPDIDDEDDIDFHQFYEKIQSAHTNTEDTPSTKKAKIDSPDKPTCMDIVNATMNAAAEGRLMETTYTMSMPRIQIDPISMAAVASLEEYTGM